MDEISLLLPKALTLSFDVEKFPLYISYSESTFTKLIKLLKFLSYYCNSKKHFLTSFSVCVEF